MLSVRRDESDLSPSEDSTSELGNFVDIFDKIPELRTAVFYQIRKNLGTYHDKALAKSMMDKMALIIAQDWVDKMLSKGKKDEVISALRTYLTDLAIDASKSADKQKEIAVIQKGITDILVELTKPNLFERAVDGVLEFFVAAYDMIGRFFDRLASFFRSQPAANIAESSASVTDAKAIPTGKDPVMSTAGYVQKLSSNKSKIPQCLDFKYSEPELVDVEKISKKDYLDEPIERSQSAPNLTLR